MANTLPYLKTILKGIKGIIPNDVYEDNNQIIIPIISGSCVTDIREQMVERIKHTWLKDYIDKIKLTQGYFIMTLNINETLTNSINEALEIPVVKDGELKLPVDELVVRNYDEYHRYGTDWVTEYNYVSKKSLTKEEFEKLIKDAGYTPTGIVYDPTKRKLTMGNGDIYYRHICKSVMF